MAYQHPSKSFLGITRLTMQSSSAPALGTSPWVYALWAMCSCAHKNKIFVQDLRITQSLSKLSRWARNHLRSSCGSAHLFLCVWSSLDTWFAGAYNFNVTRGFLAFILTSMFGRTPENKGGGLIRVRTNLTRNFGVGWYQAAGRSRVGKKRLSSAIPAWCPGGAILLL